MDLSLTDEQTAIAELSHRILSEQLPPAELVAMLNRIFSMFDQLAEKHGLEKIKTIGDEYMAASGLPMPRADHAEAMAEMALDMLAVIERFNAKRNRIAYWL